MRKLTLFSHYSLGKVTTKNGDGMPHLVWPDRAPCLMANLYMLSLRERRGRAGRQGLSRRGSKGGTMGEYAQKLSQIIRFCYLNKWDFIELTDDTFTLFINNLRSERSDTNPEQRKKTETTITAVGRVCLDFLSFVGAFHGDPDFVSPQGVIRATKKTVSIKISDRNSEVTRSYWHHHSFSHGERKKKRNPIPAETIEKLRKAVDEAGGSRFLVSRRHCTLSILEQVGARRGEVAEIRVSDVIKASKMEYPMLRIMNLKHGDDEFRFVPVTHMLLSELKKHIRLFRNKVIKDKLGRANDHDYLFIAERTGKPLSETRTTSEIAEFRRIAKIEEAACAHMFRHTFITNLFVLLIERHEFENPDDFRRSIITNEKFKMEIMQWTGHKSSTSLEHYIDLAFASISGYAKTVSSVHLIKAQKIFDKMLLELTDRLQRGSLSIHHYNAELHKLIELRNKDFESAQRGVS